MEVYESSNPVILTRELAAQIRFIHDRMPLILPEHLLDAWIDPAANPAELVREAVTDMMAEKAVMGCFSFDPAY